MYKKLDETLVETTIENHNNLIDDIDSIDDNIKNLKRETKLSEYCKKAKKESEECYKFLQMDRKHEESIKANIETFYDYLMRSAIEKILRNEGLYERWFEKIYELTKKTISQVNPSFKDLKDSLDINDYVKVKTISFRDYSLCKVIDGFAFQKNVCSKKMNTNIDNPKILLLDCGLDYNRRTNRITNYVENLMTQETAYFDIIMKKIDLVQPTVILVNKNVSLKIREDFSSSNKISLVMNVKSNSLKKIARCTKTYVLPSTDLIDKQTILGTCKKFRVEKIKLNNEVRNKDNLKNNEYNLMVFEGCDYLLHCTIILSGPDESELKALKKILRTILLTVRDLYLQKFFQYFSFNEISPNFEEKFNELNSRVSISSSKNSVYSNYGYCNALSNLTNNASLAIRSNIILNNAISCFNKFELENSHFLRDYINGFDTSIVKDRSRTLLVTKLTISQGVVQSNFGFERNISIPADRLQPGNFAGNNGELAEQEVLKIVNSICGEPQDLELVFYSDKEYYDKPLGKMIIDLCAESDVKCEICKKAKGNHIHYMYKKFGRVKVQMLQNHEEHLEKIIEVINRENSEFSRFNPYYRTDKCINYNMDIYSFSSCKLCQKIVTPLVKLPREVFNLSIAKYFKNMLFNHDVKLRPDTNEYNLIKAGLASGDCHHYSNKDLTRTFITKIGTIKFSYENSPIYLIETSPLNERKDTAYFVQVLETYIRTFRDKSGEILEYLKQNFKYIIDDLSDLIHRVQIEDQKINSQLTEIIERIMKLAGKYLNTVSEIINFIENVFTLPPKFDDYVKATVFIKKIYFRIVQVKIAQNYHRKTIRKLKGIISYHSKMKNVSIHYEKDAMNTNLSYQSSGLSNEEQQNFTNIDHKECYKSILKEINFFDDNHNKYSSDICEEDLSSIIAYTLTSDKYREHISPNNRFKLIDIKCERRAKLNYTEINLSIDNKLSEIKQNESTAKAQDENNEQKYGYNLFSTQDEEVYDTSLLFDQTKNTYQYQNLDNHKINQQLETELLSDEKTHFTFNTYSYNLMTYLTTWNLPIEFNTGNRLKKDMKSSNSIAKQNFTDVNIDSLNLDNLMEDKHILQGDNIKSSLEDLDNIRLELKALKDVSKQNMDNKAKDKHKKLEFIEEILISPIECEVIVYYPRQFESLRITYCATYDDFILSVNII